MTSRRSASGRQRARDALRVRARQPAARASGHGPDRRSWRRTACGGSTRATTTSAPSTPTFGGGRAVRRIPWRSASRTGAADRGGARGPVASGSAPSVRQTPSRWVTPRRSTRASRQSTMRAPVTVGLSVEVPSVDFSVLLVRTARVAGHVTNPDGTPTTAGNVTLMPERERPWAGRQRRIRIAHRVGRGILDGRRRARPLRAARAQRRHGRAAVRRCSR